MINLFFAFFASVFTCFFVSIPIVWILKVFKVRQVIREDGPKAHIKKAGTPTMGGIAVVLTIVFFILIFINVELNLKYAALLMLLFGYALLGFLDDYLKIKRNKNLGLTPMQKIFGQVFFAGLFAAALAYSGHADFSVGLISSLSLNNLLIYVPLVIFIVIGTSNAVNLTDGLDGLLSGVLAVAFIAFAFIAFKLQFNSEAFISVISAGALFAFLRFNFHPAEVFLGDLGSLSLGALLAGVAILIHQELLLIVIGGVFVVEALSVIAQVFSYKVFKRRILRMSPLHHHFELLGISEPRIVIGFYLTAFVLGVLGVLIYKVF